MLTAVEGIAVGHVTYLEDGTGCTVIIPPRGTTGAVDVRGGGAGSRETEAIAPLAGERDISAILLSGGSAFGLAAASGVARWCERDGRGVDTGAARVPIVPAAVSPALTMRDACWPLRFRRISRTSSPQGVP